jgi:hypothetical protein
VWLRLIFKDDQSRVSGSIFDPVAAATVEPDQNAQPSLRRLEVGLHPRPGFEKPG